MTLFREWMERLRSTWRLFVAGQPIQGQARAMIVGGVILLAGAIATRSWIAATVLIVAGLALILRLASRLQTRPVLIGSGAVQEILVMAARTRTSWETRELLQAVATGADAGQVIATAGDRELWWIGDPRFSDVGLAFERGRAQRVVWGAGPLDSCVEEVSPRFHDAVAAADDLAWFELPPATPRTEAVRLVLSDADGAAVWPFLEAHRWVLPPPGEREGAVEVLNLGPESDVIGRRYRACELFLVLAYGRDNLDGAQLAAEFLDQLASFIREQGAASPGCRTRRRRGDR